MQVIPHHFSIETLVDWDWALDESYYYYYNNDAVASWCDRVPLIVAVVEVANSKN